MSVWPALLAAPFVGSFLGTLVLRLPRGQPLLWGRSTCPHCGITLRARELVPMLSWLIQRGRCRHCRARLGGYYPAMELAAVATAVWAATETSGGVLWLSCGLGWTLLTLALLDRRHFWLPDVLTLPLAAAGLAATTWLDPPSLTGHALAALLGWGAFAGVAFVYRRLRGRDGLGGGDAKLLAAAGAWLGPAALPGVVLIACSLALLEILARAAGSGGVRGTDRLAFGTWLAAGLWLAWLYGAPGFG